ncbi:unnamed protein product [Blepharisma stoltei]|uniref:Next to BRCA1 gene 1 protein n=1 Tax=Blepharisma stoltei TaxID=1481888 RepID=A0AAU9K0V5_9CILI|nr:unnamed protein product [Blepharisma stoltei]
MSLKIKLVYNKEIRKLVKRPETIEDLKAMTQKLFGYKDFCFKYEDTEGDIITISSDSELEDAYEEAISEDIKSIKLYAEEDKSVNAIADAISGINVKNDQDMLPIKRPFINNINSYERNDYEEELRKERKYETAWDNIGCAYCSVYPITGNCYQCTICYNFNLCEDCYFDGNHMHPLVKRIKHGLFGGRNVSIYIPPSMRILNTSGVQNGETVEHGGEIIKKWTILNNGEAQWPHNCTLAKVNGQLEIDPINIPKLMPGDITEIVAVVRVQERSGIFHGEWRLQTPAFQMFGDAFKLEVVVRTLSHEEKVAKMVDMGFGEDASFASLVAHNWDLDAAIASHLIGL